MIKAIILGVIILCPLQCFGGKIATKYGIIQYAEKELLISFNEKLDFGKYNYLLRNDIVEDAMDEVRNKIETIVQATKVNLEMHPEQFSYTIVLLALEEDVRRAYRSIYGKETKFIAFYSPRKKTIYLSVSTVTLHILVHEIAHVVIDHYFGVAPSVKIHEVLAQYAESYFRE